MRNLIGALALMFVSTTMFAQGTIPAPKKTADKKFWSFALAAYATAYATAFADEEVTQYGIAHGFHESNPILGTTRLRAYPVIIGLATGSVVESYFLKKDGSKWWFAPATVTIGIHGFAVGYNLVLVH
jgi:hypothetical protein